VGLKLAGQAPAAEVDSGATLVVRENLETPEIRGLLFPEVRR
jgi:hypothetical protein